MVSRVSQTMSLRHVPAVVGGRNQTKSKRRQQGFKPGRSGQSEDGHEKYNRHLDHRRRKKNFGLALLRGRQSYFQYYIVLHGAVI